MEVGGQSAEVVASVSVLDFNSYQSGQAVSCIYSLCVGSLRAKFNIHLELFSLRRLFRTPTKSNKATPKKGVTTPRTCSSNKDYKYSPVLNKDRDYKSSPTLNRNYSPSGKKNGFKNLYTCGGIEEIIHNNQDICSFTGSPLKNVLKCGDRDNGRHTPNNGKRAVPLINRNTPDPDRNAEGKQVRHTPDNPKHGYQSDAGADTPERDQFDHFDQFDVTVQVTCIESTAPMEVMKLLQIVSGIGDRLEQERALVYEATTPTAFPPTHSGANVSPTWVGTLVPRISIKTHDMLQHGALVAWLKFIVPTEVLRNSTDGLHKMADDMRMLQTNKESSDGVLLTSDGGSLPVHLAVLKARSSLLSTATIINDKINDIGIMVNGKSPSIRRLDIKTNKNSDIELTLTEESFLSVFDYTASFIEAKQVQKSPRKHSNTPNYLSKSPLKSGVKTALSSKYVTTSSPRKVLSEKPSLFKKPSCPPSLLSPKPRYTPAAAINKIYKETINKKQPIRDLNQCFIEDEDTYNLSLTSTLSLKSDTESYPELDEISSIIENELKENIYAVNLNVNSSNIKKNEDDRVLIEVNMSTSVTKQLLEWIYTGSCSGLATLCRPLLVAGRRHGVPDLCTAAERHLAAALSPQTAPTTLLLAHNYQAWSLLDAALLYTKKHAEEVINTHAWETAVQCCPQLALKVTRMLSG